jgi:hypothetical protein
MLLARDDAGDRERATSSSTPPVTPPMRSVWLRSRGRSPRSRAAVLGQKQLNGSDDLWKCADLVNERRQVEIRVLTGDQAVQHGDHVDSVTDEV